MIFFTKKLFAGFAFGCFCHISLQSQSQSIERLRQALSNPMTDQLATLFALCKQGSSLQSDSFMKYARTARQISLAKNDLAGRLLAEFYIGKCFVFEGKADSGLQISETDMSQVSDINKQYSIYHELWWLKITCLSKLRKYDSTFSECYKLLESGEKYNDLAAQLYAANGIGSAYFNFSSDFVNAKKWWCRSYRLLEGTQIKRDFPQVLINLSYLYYGIDKNTDSAQFYLDQAFAIAEQTQSLRVFADCYTTQADIDNLEHKTAAAEEMLKKGLALYKQIGNTASIIEGLSTLIDFYTDRKDYAKAILYGKQTEEYLTKSNSGQLTEFYRSSADIYEKTGNYLMADSMLRKFIHVEDSLYNKTKVEDLARLEAKYELSNKEAFIIKQKFELLRKDIWIVSVVVFTLLLAAGAYFWFRRSKRKQVIALSEAEEKERKRIAADLHDHIGAYASAISAGIDEIESKKLITDASAIHHLKSNATEIITSLRDTIWAFNKESVTLTGISDRLKTYIQKMQPTYPHVNILLEENISVEKKLSPVQALHIFRIVQEALHNALRHSHADQVLISILGDPDTTGITIKDNGKGFEPGAIGDAGNGLLNMKSRAAEADFDLAIQSRSPKGTKIELRSRFRK
jgi:signal transduction histidine kinase